MVAPVTGPFYKETKIAGPPSTLPPHLYGSQRYWFRKEQWWYKQKKPYKLNLPYTMDRKSVSHVDPDGYNVVDAGSAPAYSPGDTDDAYNKAYSKFVDKMGESSQWAVNYIERKQAMSQIEETAVRLRKFTLQVRRFDFGGAANTLGVGQPRKLRRATKAFANNWLAYHFGWEQLVKDMHHAKDTLDEIPRPQRVVSKASHSSRVHQDVNFPNGYTADTTTTTKVRLSADVSVSNPDIYRMNKLGLLNPAGTAWELIPWSFLVDWFVNIGDCINSFTDFAGLNVSERWTTILQTRSYTETGRGVSIGNRDDFLGVYLRRVSGISGPTLKIRPLKALSPVRAATAIALLVQQLRLK